VVSTHVLNPSGKGLSSMNSADSRRRKRRSFGFLAGSVVGGSAVSMAFQMIGGVLIGRLVAPATLGLFAGIGLVLGYVPLLQLGVLNGLNRELPYFVGKGDRQRVTQLAAAAQAWALLVGGIVCAALLGVAGWQLAHGELWKAAGWFTNAILAVLLFYNGYLQTTYRTSQDFARLALAGVLQSSVGLALIASVAVLNFYGLCLRALLAATAGALILFWWRPVRIGPRWGAEPLKHLLRIGVPIFVVGQANTLWAVANRTLVLKLAGTEGIGLYSMAVLAGTAMALLPTAVSQIVYPRMAEHYGRMGNAADLFRIALRPMIVTAVALVPVIAAAWLLAGPAVRLIMPAYVDAVPAIQWTLPIAIVSSFGPANNVFNVVRRQRLYLVAILVGIVTYGVSLLWLVHDSVTLAAFPQAMLIGQAVYMATCYAFIWWLLRREMRET